MMRYRATLAYDGSAYYGYQRQPDVPTIQGEVEQALERVLGQPTTVWAAGRTDTGVHATGQVIAFDAAWKHDAHVLLRAINVYLPEDIALQALWAQPDFHPRYDALSRTYRYHVAVVDVRQPLLAKRAWQLHGDLDETLLTRAAETLLGEHDFSSFGTPPHGTNTVRHVFRSQWQSVSDEYGTHYLYEVEATAFLYHMVRRMVGIQVAVARGSLSLEQFDAIVASRNLAQHKWLAPPQGLTFIRVRYPHDEDSAQPNTQTENDGRALRLP